MRLAIAAVVLFVVGNAVAGRVAEAQTIEEGRRAYLEADFENAITTFEAVLEKPSLTREEAADAHRYLTTLRTLQGESDAAARHAAFAVALDPSVDPPQGSPDEVAALFGASLEVTGGQPAQLTIQSDTLRREQPATVRARFAPAPDGLVDVIELRCAAGGEPVSNEGPPPEVELTLEPTADARCRATALTAARAALATARETLELTRVVTATPTSTAASGDDREASSRKAWPWVLVSILVVGAAVAVPLLIIRPFGADDAQLGSTRIEGW